MSDQFKFRLYEWAEWATKALLIGMSTLLWNLNGDLTKALQTQAGQREEIAQIRSDLKSLEAKAMMRSEAMELMKRVEQQLQILQWQPFEAGVAAFKAQVPNPTQRVRQVLAGGVGQVHRGFAGSDGEFFFARQLAMGIEGGRHSRACQRQACDEPTSRDGHCLP